jgi:hypothetical protein
MNEHVKNIQDLVFHSYPYNRLGFSPNTPHAEDCEGCRINEEVKKLVYKLDALSPVEKIVEELKNEKELRESHDRDRNTAFKIAGVERESVSDLVTELVEERNHLRRLLETVKIDINNISKKIK